MLAINLQRKYTFIDVLSRVGITRDNLNLRIHEVISKKPSLASILTDCLKSKRGEIVHGGELEYVAKANGHEAEPGK
jgi:hypothetical protein